MKNRPSSLRALFAEKLSRRPARLTADRIAGLAKPGALAGPAAMSKLFSICLAILVCPGSGAAYQSGHAGGPAAPSAAQPPENVTIDVVVTGKAGKPVPGLQQQDFTLLDDKHEKPLLSFRAVDLQAHTPAPPQELVVVIDAINVDVTHAAMERNGIKHFLQDNGGKLPLPVSLITVTDAGMATPVAPSLDGNALAAKLDQSVTGIPSVTRSSAFGNFERYELSLKALDQVIALEAPKPGRKLVVWVSPGWPLLAQATQLTDVNQRQLFNLIVRTSTVLRLGHITLYNVVSRAQSANVGQFWNYTEYVAGVKSQSQAFPANLALPVLVLQSGGLVLNGSNDLPQAMAAEIATTAADAQVFYVLTFPVSPSDHANEYHSIQVKVNQPGVTVRTRAGYYAQP